MHINSHKLPCVQLLAWHVTKEDSASLGAELWKQVSNSVTKVWTCVWNSNACKCELGFWQFPASECIILIPLNNIRILSSSIRHVPHSIQLEIGLWIYKSIQRMISSVENDELFISSSMLPVSLVFLAWCLAREGGNAISHSHAHLHLSLYWIHK